MTPNERHNVLMVSCVYYPCLIIGAHRAGKFSWFLREFGWQPTVLTFRDWYYDTIDEKLSEQIPPDIEVVRTDNWNVSNIRRFIRNVRNLRSSPSSPSKGGKSSSKKGSHGLTDWFEVPGSIGWLPFGYLGGLRAARRSDVIWATSPWTGGLCLGAMLARTCGKPFVADLRDPWRVKLAHSYPTRLHEIIDSRWERFVFDTAQKILVVTPEMQTLYRDRYPKHEKKISVLYNGYDSADFRDLPVFSTEDGDKDALKIGYVGTLYGGREECMRSFLEAVYMIRRQNRDRKIRIYYRGPNSNVLTAISKKFMMTKMIDYGDTISYTEALSLMCGMDINLLLGSAQHGYALPGKLFEYIGAGKPVLAVTPGGAIRDFVTHYGLGVAPDPSDPDDIATQLDSLVTNYTGFAERFSAAAEKFDRRKLTGQLANVLEDMRQ